MALGGAIAVTRRQRGFHCGIVLTQPLGKAFQLTPGTGKHPRYPGIEPFGGQLPHHLRKSLCMGSHGREERIGLLDLEELGLLGFRTHVRTPEQAVRHLASGQRRGRRRGRRCCGGLWSAAAPNLTLPPGSQHAGHAPVPPTEALGAQLMPQMGRTVLPGLPVLPQIRPILCETTAIAGATFALGEALPRELIAIIETMGVG
jgi:hypothetical protein